MAEEIRISTLLPASPEEIYAAWLDSEKHAAMTGGEAEISDQEGESFTAWDGYISGNNLELNPGNLIVQSWRTVEFPADAPDSLLEVELLKEPSGCKLILRHANIPDGDGDKYLQGWQEHYFTPMKEYFGE